MAARPLRQWAAKLHLYLGLGLGGLFVLMGLTGSAIAWLPELDALLNPALLRAAPASPSQRFEVTPATVQTVFDTLAADPRYGTPTQLNPPADAHDVYIAAYRRPLPAGAGAAQQAVTRQVMLDPYTLRVVGERDWGRYGLSRPLLMPTLFHLHRYLLSGEVGKTVTGIAGLALLLLALCGLLLWWPRASWAAVRRALRVAHGGSWPRFHSSLHRAGGFFAAPVLLMLAFSGVYLNLPQLVLPLVGALSELAPAGKLGNAAAGAAIAPGAAMARAQALYPRGRVSRIAPPAKAAAPYEIRLRQPGEAAAGDGATRVVLDAVSGRPLRVRDPLTAAAGERFLGWLYPLHSGQAFGAPGRVFISLFGLAPLLFFVTGLLMWRKRRPKPGRR
ncbi:PepSY-associated TM helix domain-containing protein [Janthinobacterium sp.]|uniref:PepSY-associated TM helix domain-containing protein n=1 Tax=Janthinobacterium sp. TaxID=1871054 RepID=UPI00293D419E|nr:PepSY-associated TM helix domain-containing protein [Janthinobacterium sp.]